jgi:TRAP-type transport system small permease protein
MPEKDAVVESVPTQLRPAKANTIGRIIHKLLSSLEKEVILGVVVLFVMMMLTVSDVIGRYFFNHPIQGTNEITGLSLALVAASALSYSQIKKGHIRVDIITNRLSPKGKIILEIIAYFFCLVGSAVITWQTFIRGTTYIFATRGNVTETLGIPFFPFMLIVALGFFLLAIVSLVDFIRSLVKVVGK